MKVINTEKAWRRLQRHMGERVSVLEKNTLSTTIEKGYLSFDDVTNRYYVDSEDDSIFFDLKDVYNVFIEEEEPKDNLFIVLEK